MLRALSAVLRRLGTVYFLVLFVALVTSACSSTRDGKPGSRADEPIGTAQQAAILCSTDADCAVCFFCAPATRSCQPVAVGTQCGNSRTGFGHCDTTGACCGGSTNCISSTTLTCTTVLSSACGENGDVCGSCFDWNDCTADSCAFGTCQNAALVDGTSCGTKTPTPPQTPPGKCYNANCCPGCWDGTTCQAGHALDACGIGGVACGKCDDGNSCTSEACGANGTCFSAILSDGTSCPGGLCYGANCCTGCYDASTATCQGGTSVTSCGVGGQDCKSCDDGQECTVDACGAGGCSNTAKQDGTSCANGTGQCHGGACCAGGCFDPSTGKCVQGGQVGACNTNGGTCVSCVDSNPCTNDVCNADGTCSNPANAGGNSCTVGTSVGTCRSGGCCTGCWTGSVCVALGSETTSQCGAQGAFCAVCNDGNPCSVDACANGACTGTTPAANTVQCRPSAGPCDVAENCTGSSTACPTDGFVSASTACRPANGGCDLAENCTGSSAACPADAVKTNGTVCRAATSGGCDVAEACDGASTACPADGYKGAGTVCRTSAGVCDVQETCTGSGPNCPADGFQSSSVSCRGASCDASTNTATLAANCSGSSASCPPVQTVSCSPQICSGTACAGCTTDASCGSGHYCAGGVCQNTISDGGSCNGDNQCTNGHCVSGICCNAACTGACEACNQPGTPGKCLPLPNTTVCRAAAGVCDTAETCNGTATTCPADAKQPASFVCRAASGGCDVAETCAGGDSCPADQLATAGTTCRAAAGECDVAETCPGGTAACPADMKVASGTSCSTDNNPCTVDQCNGSASACQHPAGNGGAVCRPSAGICDVAETCTGSTTTCPSDGFVSGTVCRVAAGECDVAESCNGSSAACPTDGFKSGACTDDGNPCTKDVCSGAATCSHPPGNGGAVCRTAAGECDSAETCDGVTSACPGDSFKTNGTACTPDALPCTADVCDGSGVCGHPPGNAGAVCRAAVSECDTPESCTGASTTCPTDAFKPAGTNCTPDTEKCTDDACDGAGACAHPPGNAGVVCRAAAGACDVDEKCSGSSTACPTDAFKSDGISCSDGNACNGAESCLAGVCKAGTALSCNDGNTCTTDTCDPVNGCSNANVTDGTTCNDGNTCNTGDACQAGVCKGTGGPDCDDHNPCTVDGCNQSDGSCTHVNAADGAACSDGNVCTQSDSCQAGVCTGTNPLNCDDGNACTTDSCDPATGCKKVNVTDDTPCADANLCDGSEKCTAGVCKPGTALDCDDKNACTTDTCSPATGCDHQAIQDGTSCSDGNPCNGVETCAAGVCAPGQALVCNDGDPCTSDSCDPVIGGCKSTAVPNNTPCPDGDACNGTETCKAGACIPATTPVDCDDADPCTTDSCDAASGCKHTAVKDGTPCNDADACTKNESCQAGQCKGTDAVNCDDGNPCTTDVCDPVTGCGFTKLADGTTCDDGNPCSNASACRSGECHAATGQLDCFDGDPCTADSCDVNTQVCTFTDRADGSACSDGNACTVGDSCLSGLCQQGAKLDCDDQNRCTFDQCDQSTGCEHFPLDGNLCTDGNACTSGDRCVQDQCQPTDTVTCTALDVCHVAGTCDSTTGVCDDPNQRDGTSCGIGLKCASGVCGGSGAGGAAAGGAGGQGGSGGTSPDAGTGGTSGAGGTGTGGVGGAGGATRPDAGTSPDAAAGTTGAGGTDTGTGPLFERDPQGCACRTGRTRGNDSGALLGVLLALTLAARRNQRRTAASGNRP